jgi:predicted GTPase
VSNDSAPIAAWLEDLARLALELGDKLAAEDVTAAAARCLEREFIVACVGQFKRGKSTLVNALLGEPVLPTGVTPVTSVPTLVRFGPPDACVLGQEGSWIHIRGDELARFVSEEENPGNRRGIVAVEVFRPRPILANGLCLIDTPGLGSVFEANTRAARDVLPRIDVVLLVTGADPPLTADELHLIGAAAHVDTVCLVINKADKSTRSELTAARSFALDLFHRRLGRSIDQVFEVSAVDALSGIKRWPDWERLASMLMQLASRHATELSRNSGHRAVERIGGRLIAGIDAAAELLTEPLDALKRRAEAAERAMAESSHRLVDLSPRLDATEQRLVADFARTAARFKQACQSAAHDQLTRRLDVLPRTSGPSLRRRAMEGAQHITRATIEAWLPDARDEAGRVFQLSTERFITDVTNAWNSLKGIIPGLPELAESDVVEAMANNNGRFVFNEQTAMALPASPLRYIGDLALAAIGLRRVIVRDAHRFVDWLLELNVSRVERDVSDRIQDSRVRLEYLLRTRLSAVRAQSAAVFDHAKRVREAGQLAVARDATRLAAARDRITEILATARQSALTASGPSAEWPATNH